MKPEKNIENGKLAAEEKLRESIGNRDAFNAPEGYFDTFPQKLMGRIRQEESGKVIPFYKRPIFRNIAAAAAVFVMVALVITLKFSGGTQEVSEYTGFSADEVYQYNIHNLADLEEAYLLSFLEEDTLDASFFFEFDEENITDEMITEYLLAENHIEYLSITDY